MGIEATGPGPDPRIRIPGVDYDVPEVPKSVTDATRDRQEAAGDPLKDAAIARQNEIRDNFPEFPDKFTPTAQRNDENPVDPKMDQEIVDGVREQDEQDKMDRYTKRY